MRAMTEWRRRLRASGKFEGGKLMLFFGARTKEELPYFGPLQNLPKDFIDINFAFSRTPGQPKRYVQDLMRERAADLALLLADPNTFFYVCGLKSMEDGVVVVGCDQKIVLFNPATEHLFGPTQVGTHVTAWLDRMGRNQVTHGRNLSGNDGDVKLATLAGQLYGHCEVELPGTTFDAMRRMEVTGVPLQGDTTGASVICARNRRLTHADSPMLAHRGCLTSGPANRRLWPVSGRSHKRQQAIPETTPPAQCLPAWPSGLAGLFALKTLQTPRAAASPR